MESSFKKGYDKKVNADGSFELSFQSRRLMPVAFSVILPLVLYPVSCAVSFPLVGGLSAARSDNLSLTTWNVVSIMVAVAIVIFIFKCFISSRSQILVKPDIGISFNNKQLPFKDISSIGTINLNSMKKGASVIYADTHGTQVKLSSCVAEELAEAIAEEIKSASGIKWNRT
jgi:hypothetical protein